MPSLVDVTDADDPPFWPRIAARVNDAVASLPRDQPILLVAHSNAGVFVPVVVQAARRPVAGCLFVDARLPSRTGPTPTASPERLDYLRTTVTGGRLPQWTAWWDEDDVARLFPDPQTRSAVSAEQPRLPLSYYEQRVPVPAGWDDRPCGYLLFGPPYDGMAAEARDRGWDVDEVRGEHLHQLVDPDAVTARIVAMTEDWGASAGRRGGSVPQ
ncbi:alpha/beta hydrolase [Rugosimonospora africana]|uniref:alpha/beta hydrolase n=1 Tax=Rugosimonospora africana TaxID=556532 RepID=UPI001EF16CA5|nr:alpha/beta hydrolase [Rugosimonospora africana]